LNELSICPPGKVWVYCLKSLKKPSIYPLGKTPSAPSEMIFPVPRPPNGTQPGSIRNPGETHFGSFEHSRRYNLFRRRTLLVLQAALRSTRMHWNSWTEEGMSDNVILSYLGRRARSEREKCKVKGTPAIYYLTLSTSHIFRPPRRKPGRINQRERCATVLFFPMIITQPSFSQTRN